jgi:hypothetical protein
VLETVSDNTNILTSTDKDEDEDYNLLTNAAPSLASEGKGFDFDSEVITTAAYRGVSSRRSAVPLQ